MSVTKSNRNNIVSPNGNALAVFKDASTGQLFLKDINGVVERLIVGSFTIGNLQQVLNEGNAATQDMSVNGNINFGSSNTISVGATNVFIAGSSNSVIENSFSIGKNNTLTKTSLSTNGIFALGFSNDVNEQNALAIGWSNSANSSNGDFNLTIGKSNQAQGTNQYLIGDTNIAQNNSNIYFFGNNINATSQNSSFGLGQYLEFNEDNFQLAIGEYNINQTRAGYNQKISFGVGINGTNKENALVFWKENASPFGNLAELNAKLLLSNYGLGNITGTVTFNLGVDVDGNVVETDPSLEGSGNQYNIPVYTSDTKLSGLTASTSLPSSDSLTAGISATYLDLGGQGPGLVPSTHIIKNYDSGGNNTATYTFGQTGRLQTNFLSVGNTNSNSTLDVSATNNDTAATFRGGIILSNNPGGVQVDNTSMCIGSGSNDNVTGSDHCLIVGSGNLITSNSDQSVAFGQGNSVTNSTDAFATGNNNAITNSLRTQSFGFNNAVNAASSFVAGGDNAITATNNAFILGYNHTVTGTSSKSFLFGQDITLTGGQSNYAIGTSLDAGAGEHMVLGYRNYPTDYPTPNKNLGLGDTKFIVAVGSGNVTPANNNAIIITEGGINGGNSGTVPQVPRVLLPTIVGFNFADDTAAASGGIPVGGLYHTSGTLKIRIT